MLPTLADVLDLERIEVDLFRATVVYEDPWSLYGGQVAAQALRAAAHTVGDDRHPHSLHGYFLSPGDASRPVLFKVHRDRDGRSYSNRRVVAIQSGKVILNLTASFQASEEGSDWQPHQMPDVMPADDVTADTETRMLSVVVRVPPQDTPDMRFPSLSWLCVRDALETPIEHACALTYVSDFFTGLGMAPGADVAGGLTSLDHAVWFHRQARMTDWVLMDLLPESTNGGRGMYTGRIWSRNGQLVASLAQESLFRVPKGAGP
jgi:acyl-CoA thioesterase II